MAKTSSKYLTGADKAIVDSLSPERVNEWLETITLSSELIDALTTARAEIIVPFSGQLDTATIYSITGDGPTGANAIVTIKKNGTLIGTDYQLTDGTVVSAALPLTGPPTFVAGDRILVELTQVGSTTAGKGYKVNLAGIRT